MSETSSSTGGRRRGGQAAQSESSGAELSEAEQLEQLAALSPEDQAALVELTEALAAHEAALLELADLPAEDQAALVDLAAAGVDLTVLSQEPQAPVVVDETPAPSSAAPPAVPGDREVAPNSTGAKETPTGKNPHQALADRATSVEESALAVDEPVEPSEG